MSITAAGWPSPAARFTTRPPARRLSRCPPTSYCSTSGSTSRGSPPAASRSPTRSISTSKCPALASTAPSFIRAKCSRRSTAAAAGHRHEEIAAFGGVEHGHHLEALHPGLERVHRVDLAHDHVGARAAGALGDPLARRAVAQQDERVAREQQVGGAQDPVERRLARAVAVVERALGARLVHREHRAAQAAVRLQAPQAQQARGGLLGPPDQPVGGVAGVHDGEQVRAVVDRDLRLALHQRGHVLGVGVEVLAADGVHLDLGRRAPRPPRPGSRAGWPSTAPPARPRPPGSA